jgi:ureidoglycolate lyase
MTLHTGVEIRTVRVELLGPDAFAPFGTAVGVFGSREADVAGPNWSGWYPLGDVPATLPLRIGLVETTPLASPLEVMEQHAERTECAFAIDSPVVFSVAHASPDGSTPDAATVRAFVVLPGQGIVRAPGTWHAAGAPLGAAPARYLFGLAQESPTEVNSGWVRFGGQRLVVVDAAER